MPDDTDPPIPVPAEWLREWMEECREAGEAAERERYYYGEW